MFNVVKKIGASGYGLLFEKIIEELLENNGNISSLNKIIHIIPKELRNNFSVNEFQDIASLITKEFINNNIILQYQVEIDDVDSNIVGHPDLVSVDTIYDIKTTGRFGRMRTNTILQLLSYYCLSQVKGTSIKNIGLVLPLQLQVVTYDLSLWDWKPFYKELKQCVIKKESTIDKCHNLTISSQIEFMILYNQYVGHHCAKNQLLESINDGKPLQFFLSGNQTSKISYTKKFEADLKKSVRSSTAPIFIHSPYILNLCHPGKGKTRENDDEIKKELGKEIEYGGWTFYCIKQIFQFAIESGIQGIVVHCGQTCGNEYKQCLDTMRDSVIVCSQWATENCKLIIETPAGEKGDVLYDPEELQIFYNTLPDFVKKVVNICVDTCHVFSAGYNPIEYINTLHKSNVPICLIHYNDSKGDLGCKRDRHARIGRGRIDLNTLMDVLMFSITNNIPMVTE